jgi:hypothetical protein
MKKTIVVIFILLFVWGPAIAMQPLPLNRNAGKTTVELVASLQKEKVNIYRIERTSPIAPPEICYVTVGELHGKTVAMTCL